MWYIYDVCSVLVNRSLYGWTVLQEDSAFPFSAEQANYCLIPQHSHVKLSVILTHTFFATQQGEINQKVQRRNEIYKDEAGVQMTYEELAAQQ